MPIYEKLGGEEIVSSGGADNSSDAAVTALAGGGYVVTWTQAMGDPSGYAAYAHIFDASGAPVGAEFRVNSHTQGNQGGPDVTALANGGFVVSWNDDLPKTPVPDDDAGYAVRAQVYGPTGVSVGGEFLVNTLTLGDQSGPALSALDGGGFVVVWTDGSGDPDPDTVGVKAQIFDDAGAKIGGEITVPALARGDQVLPDVAGLSGGGFVAVWADNGSKPGDTSEFGIFARLFDASGAPVTGEFVVNTAAYLYQFRPQVTVLADGGFVVTWYDESNVDADDDSLNIKAQMFDAAGARVGVEIMVSPNGPDPQTDPVVSALPDGGFVIAWQEYTDATSLDVKAQVFDDVGQPVGDVLLVNTTTASEQSEPAIATLASGDFVVVWQDPAAFENALLIRSQLFTPAVADPGTNDTMTGGTGADTLSGLNGDDTLSGKAGDDTLYGGNGADVLKGGDGDDRMFGGDGIDTADYSDLRGVGVTVNLAIAGPQDTGGAGVDTLNGIENLVGSRADDSLTGDDGANRIKGATGNDELFGGGGDDFLYGDQGDDTLNGGAGFDTLAGGAGLDTFVFTSLDGDLVKDWQAGEVIDVTALGAVGMQLTVSGGRTFARFDLDGDGQYDDGLIVVQSTAISAADFHV